MQKLHFKQLTNLTRTEEFVKFILNTYLKFYKWMQSHVEFMLATICGTSDKMFCKDEKKDI